jgi:N-acetylglucosamine kinase-like BadF-type ATPase
MVVNEQANMLGFGVSGPSKPDAVDSNTGREHLHEAIQIACETCGGAGKIDSVFIGMGGVVSDADVQVVLGLLAGVGLRSEVPIGVDHDIRVALAGGTAGQAGIALIVGTGSSCYGRNGEGDSWRSGGWGYAIDDFGSGYYLGQQALTAIVKAVDGRGPETALVAPILEALGLSNIDEIMHRIYHPRLDHMGIAALAPAVIGCAEYDKIARMIIEHGCEELAAMVVAVTHRLHLPDDVLVVPVGSLAISSAVFRQMLEHAILKTLPHAQIRSPIAPPVAGAALLALQQINIYLTADALGQLISTG